LTEILNGGTTWSSSIKVWNKILKREEINISLVDRARVVMHIIFLMQTMSRVKEVYISNKQNIIKKSEVLSG